MANSTNTSQQAGSLLREKPLDGSMELDSGFDQTKFNGLPKVNLSPQIIDTGSTIKSAGSDFLRAMSDLGSAVIGTGEHKPTLPTNEGLVRKEQFSLFLPIGEINNFRTGNPQYQERVRLERVTVSLRAQTREEQRVRMEEANTVAREEARNELQGISQDERNKAMNLNASLDKKHTRKPFYWTQTREKLIQEKRRKEREAKGSAIKGGQGKSHTKGPGKGVVYDAEGGGYTSAKSRVG